MVLANLEFLDASPLDRSYIRIQPKKPIQAALLLNKIKLINGVIDTIAQNSLVLHVKLEDIEKIIHQDLIEKEFDVTFQIPTEEGFLTMISAKATIFSIINETIVVHIQPNFLMQSKIKKYVSFRQNDLLVELKQQLKFLG